MCLKKLYQDKVGNPELIEVVKASGELDTDSLAPHKVKRRFVCSEKNTTVPCLLLCVAG